MTTPTPPAASLLADALPPRLVDVPHDSARQSVGKGWHPIIDAIYWRLDAETLPWSPALARAITIAQVKEKFGSLRCYQDIHPEAVEAVCALLTPTAAADYRENVAAFWQRVAQCELVSSFVCEDCGRPGRLRWGSWLRTLCDDCAGAGVSSEEA